MKRLFVVLLLALVLTLGQRRTPALANSVMLPYQTPVELRLESSISSRDLRENMLIPVRAVSDVIVNGYIVIARGAEGRAVVVADNGAQPGAVNGSLSLQAVWIRAVDHSRIGLTGSVESLGRHRAIADTGATMNSAGTIADVFGAWGPGVLLGAAGLVTNGVAGAEKGGEAELGPQTTINAAVRNIWGVTVDSHLRIDDDTEDSPIK